jgi:hypothetical protein
MLQRTRSAVNVDDPCPPSRSRGNKGRQALQGFRPPSGRVR